VIVVRVTWPSGRVAVLSVGAYAVLTADDLRGTHAVLEQRPGGAGWVR